ncbi:MAG: SDR family oxidoreductase [Verrucomicrobia bacterium]|nr:SDR family oxidoreductase [Verrucomicrobiota bacterium]
MPTVVVTGANRGLGLEFAKQYKSDGWKVFACCRNPEAATELAQLDVSVCVLDLLDFPAIENFTNSLDGETVDLLINNAAVHDGTAVEGFSGIEENNWVKGFKVNVMGPVLVTKGLIKNLSASENPVAATIGSQEGCLQTYNTGGTYLYRTTKAAAHAASVILANDLKERNIPYVCLRPGHTKTDMGGRDAPYEIDDSVALMRQVLAKVDMELTGCFIDRNGDLIPWSLDQDLNY